MRTRNIFMFAALGVSAAACRQEPIPPMTINGVAIVQDEGNYYRLTYARTGELGMIEKIAKQGAEGPVVENGGIAASVTSGPQEITPGTKEDNAIKRMLSMGPLIGCAPETIVKATFTSNSLDINCVPEHKPGQ